MSPDFKTRSRLSKLWVVLLAFAPFFSYGQSKTGPELDVTKLGLRPRTEVIRILGRPERILAPDQDAYSWGFVGYTNGRADQIDYTFKTAAYTIEEALAKVGLEQTSSPYKGPLSYYWNDSTGPLICCGFEMDNVVIVADLHDRERLTGISVGFKRKLASRPRAKRTN